MTGDRSGVSRVLCAGDRFITAGSLAAAATARWPQARAVSLESPWPDEPFRDIDGIREGAGDPRDLVAAVDGADVLLTHLAPVTADVLDAGRGTLRAVGITRGGPVNVDLEAATRCGVPVCYLPGRNLGAVAEYVVGLMIALTRNVVAGDRELSGGRWDGGWFRYGLTGPELSASTIGLIGLGAIGARVARLVSAFGASVLAYDPYADAATAAACGARLTSFEGVLAGADIVSLHARLTDESRAMFDQNAFAAMKPGARFVNTARGELVDEHALDAALESGHLSGAALDVFFPEPPSADNPLLARGNVIVTPHLAGASRQVADLSVQRVVDEVAQYLAGGTMAHCANPAVLAGRES